jgi:hypothetical protein
MVEPLALPPETDSEELLQTSIDWCRVHLAKFIG